MLEPATAPSPSRRTTWAVAGAALAVAAYAALVVLADGRAVLDSLRRQGASTLAAALGLVLAAYALRGVRWRVYCRRLGVAPTPSEATAMGMTTGKLGQVLKAHHLHAGAGVPYGVSVPAGLAERMSDAVGIVALLLVAAGLAREASVGLLVAGGLFVLALLALLRSRRAALALARVLERAPRTRRFGEQVAHAHEHTRDHLRARELALPVALAFAAFALEGAAVAALARGLGFPLAWPEAAFVLAAADVAGMLSLLPGGMGVAEGSMVLLLAAQGAPLATAAGLTLLARACTLWLGGALDVVGAVWMRALRRAQAGGGRPSASSRKPV
ncbi:MAG TPA: lysylphosphatidylglycerol synthase transmembrane domain-containing protein [Candidatus Thermoplasmatota archaeon]|nr:lysylphosphatidylglycerol synthase transmembrane domain-containing protein [Candidatus Thermoplasmatota archaeon]